MDKNNTFGGRIMISYKVFHLAGARRDHVIKAIARLEFEDGLRTRVLPHSALEPWLVGKKVASYVDKIPIFWHCSRVKISLKRKFFN